MKRFAFLLSLLCLFTTLSRGASKPEVADAYGKLPLSFEANQGQSDAQVKFLSRGSGYTLFLTSSEAVLLLQTGAPSGGVKQHGRARIDASVPPQNLNREDNARTKSAVLRIGLVGANPAPQLTGFDDLPGKANYFIGNDPKKWRTDVPTYAKVTYHAVYPGVDLVYYGNQRQLEHDFIVAPGANPGLISLRLEGAKKLSLDSHGDLVLKTQDGEIRFQKPVVYQEVDGVRQEIAGGYKLKGKDRVGFEVATYDVTRPLVVDPTLVYSTYLGGSDFDRGFGIAVDSAGSAYVAGETCSTDFPTANPIQAANATFPPSGECKDAFVAKLNAAGSALVYSTYLGGSGYDAGFGISVDSASNAYVTGETCSNNFPTVSPIQAFPGLSCDAFVTKVNASGNALGYSTYLGGSSEDEGSGIAVDSLGSAYVTGRTSSCCGGVPFPTTAGAFQTTNAGCATGNCYDAFVAKLSADGSSLVYSTYLGGSSGDYILTFLGGSGADQGTGIAVDSAGSAYVTGLTCSTNFPTASPIQVVQGGACDAFVTKLNAAGSALVYSTYLGGSGFDVGKSIAVDSAGNAYVAGYTNGSFPTTAGASQTAYGGGGDDGFVAKLGANGSSLGYSTYLGGSGDEAGQGIAVDSAGNAYVTGYTSGNFPTTTGAFPYGGGSYDAFVTKITADGSSLLYSTYLGGSGYDAALGIAVDSASNAYVTGLTDGVFPTTTGAFQTAYGGGTYDAFVSKITDIVLNAFVQQPISPDGTSVFKASKGVIPVKFTLTLNGTATCQLPPATISLTRTDGGTIGPIDENVYMSAADTGSNFRISGCQYTYNIAASSLGTGTYRVDITINGSVVGSGTFGLK